MKQSNFMIHWDCIEVMQTLPAHCIDLIVTDPPYLARYRSRDGRTLMGDDSHEWLKPAFQEMYRLLKPDSFYISFYGWHQIDKFMSVWKKAGFRPVWHIVYQKQYSSRVSFLQSRHEQAFLLVKWSPPYPTNPLSDILPWHYSGNHLHPTQKPLNAFYPLVHTFSKPWDMILDPFCGSATTAIVAKVLKRRYLMIEKDRRYYDIALQRLQHTRYL